MCQVNVLNAESIGDLLIGVVCCGSTDLDMF